MSAIKRYNSFEEMKASRSSFVLTEEQAKKAHAAIADELKRLSKLKKEKIQQKQSDNAK